MRGGGMETPQSEREQQAANDAVKSPSLCAGKKIKPKPQTSTARVKITKSRKKERNKGNNEEAANIRITVASRENSAPIWPLLAKATPPWSTPHIRQHAYANGASFRAVLASPAPNALLPSVAAACAKPFGIA